MSGDLTVQQRVSQLELENQTLRDQVDMLRDALSAPVTLAPEWGISPSERIVLGVLVARVVATKSAILTALYSGRNDEPDQKIADVYIHKLRRRLRPLGIEIKTLWGVGWALAPEARERLRTTVAA